MTPINRLVERSARQQAAVWTGLIALGVALAAQAQQTVTAQSFDLERLTFNPSAGASLVTSTGDVLPVHQYRLSLAGHYQHEPLVVFRDNGERVGALVGYRTSTHLLGAWSPLPSLELALQVPVVVAQGGDDLSSLGLASVGGVGLGTPLVAARYGVLQQSRGQALDLSLQLAVGVPVGTQRGFGNDGALTFYPRVGAGRSFGLLRLGGEVAMDVRPTRAIGAEATGSVVNVAASLTTTGQGLRGELTGRTAVAIQGSVPLSGDLLAGVRYPLGPVEVFALGGPGLGGALGNPAFRVLAGAAFPTGSVAAAQKPLACEEGRAWMAPQCPELDLDQDSVKNGVDACLDLPGPAHRKGCPAPDQDGDGLDDDHDACPTEYAAGDGCPLKDQDRDGVPDDQDRCPAQPAVGTADGCPPPDQDGDGIADAVDRCPAQVGRGQLDGCPPKVELTDQGIQLNEAIRFATGKATVLEESRPLLDQLALLLASHQEWKWVAIEGHTDAVGAREKNLALSQARAQRVVEELVERGISRARLTPNGYGPDRPIADNQTEAGRQQNRRVEFVILKKESAR